VQNSPSQITLAEALFLVRLHCTALAIYQVLPTGADIVILSDGRLYAPILGVDEEAAQQYVNSMRHLRDHLNLRGTISIIDLKHLIELYDAESGEFEECCRYIFSQLLKWRKSTAEVMFAQQFSSLALGIRWNMNSKLLGGDHCDVAAWISSDKTHSEFPAGQKFSHPDDVDKIAARYAAVNLALRWHNVVSTMLPTAIRGTMHPKPCQVALPRLGSCFPWNGVAIAEFGRGGQIDVQVHSLCEAQRRGLDLVGRVDNKGEIVYYERRR
jgi:pyoverdine/dityrosine biosynthesis protein Dit1